jgi:hypothetical protein
MNEKVAREKKLNIKMFFALYSATENLIGVLVPVIVKKVFSSYEMCIKLIQWE